MSKITIATVKSFINKNRAALLVNQESSFDGMTDCVQSCDGGLAPAVAASHVHSNNIGVRGVWFVGNSRDYCNAYEADGVKGFSVSNCCGSFIVAIPA